MRHFPLCSRGIELLRLNLLSTKLIAMKQFVYSFLLVVVALLGAPTSLFAQCTPLDTIPGDAIIDPLPFLEEVPGSGIRDTACVGEDFSTVFNIEVPESVEIPLLGILEIDSIVVAETGVEGLPAGLGFGINPSDRVFLPNTTGCIEVSGVSAAGTEGTYGLTIGVTVYGGLIPLELNLPDGNIVPGVYNLVVRENGNPACQPNSIVESASEEIALQVYPNPANDLLKAAFTLNENMIAKVTMIDAFGRPVKELLVDALSGENVVWVEVAHLPVGFYTLLISDRNNTRKGVSQRVLINR